MIDRQATMGAHACQPTPPLPLNIDPAIAAFRHRREGEQQSCPWMGIVGPMRCFALGFPTLADMFCPGDVTSAELCGFDLERWPNVAACVGCPHALPGFVGPFDLFAMRDAAL